MGLFDIGIPSIEHITDARLHGAFEETCFLDGSIRRVARLTHQCPDDHIPLYVLSPEHASSQGAWHGSIGAFRGVLEPQFGTAQVFFRRMAYQTMRRIAEVTTLSSIEVAMTVNLDVYWRYPISGTSFDLGVVDVTVGPDVHFSWEIYPSADARSESRDPHDGVARKKKIGPQSSPILEYLARGSIDDLVRGLAQGLREQPRVGRG